MVNHLVQRRRSLELEKVTSRKGTNFVCCSRTNLETKKTKYMEEIQASVEIQEPVAVKTPKGLPEEIVAMLEARIGDEYKAHYTYRNAANWCRNANYKKAAAYFEAEANSELEHAKGLQDYLTQWNIMPQIPAVDPAREFSGLVDIVNQSYTMEYALLMAYSEQQVELVDLHPATHNFIQKYVNIQNEAVGEYSDLLNALCLINPENKLDLLYFEQTYF
jgi:ferritin